MLRGWRCCSQVLNISRSALQHQSWLLTQTKQLNNKPTVQEEETADTYNLVQDKKGRLLYYRVSGSPSQGFTYNKTAEDSEAARAETLDKESTGLFQRALAQCGRFLRSTLLPAGYPHTVGQGYWGYVAWQGVTNLAIAINTVLASTFLLYAVGLGAGAIPTAGALNWVLKDGLGQLGTLVFGKTIAHNFDIHSKSWYFLSMMILKIALGVEILTILLPQHFLILGSLAGGLKGVAFMANSSTRSVFNLSFARDNNIADITAKGTSQYICATMFGTVAGATLCTWVGQDSVTALACYTALTLVTLYGGYATVKTIPLSTLNGTRLQLLCESYLCAISAAAASKQLARRAQLASAFGPASLPAVSALAQTGIVSSQQHDMLMHQIDSDAGSYVSDDSLAGSAVTRRKQLGVATSARGVEADGGAAEYEKVYDEYLDPQLPSPAQLAGEDPPLPFLMGDQRLLDPAVIVGEALDRVLDDTGPELVVVLLSTYRLSHAIVFPRGPAVHILLHQGASQRDICQAFLQSCLLRRRMRAGSTVGLAAAHHALEVQEARRQASEREALIAAALSQPQPSSSDDQQQALMTTELTETYSDRCAVKGSSSPALAELRIVLQDTLQTAERLTSPFMRCLEAAGWKLEKVVVEAEKRRARW